MSATVGWPISSVHASISTCSFVIYQLLPSVTMYLLANTGIAVIDNTTDEAVNAKQTDPPTQGRGVVTQVRHPAR